MNTIHLPGITKSFVKATQLRINKGCLGRRPMPTAKKCPTPPIEVQKNHYRSGDFIDRKYADGMWTVKFYLCGQVEEAQNPVLAKAEELAQRLINRFNIQAN